MPADLRWMLLLDTCGAEGGVAVADLSRADQADAIVAQRILPGRETQERLMTALAEVLAEASLTAADLDAVAVVTGPGSFTGTRIGLAAAKGLAEARSLPVVALSRLAVLATQAESGDATVQAWIDAGRGDVFVGRYRDGVCLGESMMHGADAMAGLGADEMVVAMEAGIASLPPTAILVETVNVAQAFPLAAEKVGLGEFAEIALLDANYLRVPDAELARLAREGAARL